MTSSSAVLKTWEEESCVPPTSDEIKRVLRALNITIDEKSKKPQAGVPIAFVNEKFKDESLIVGYSHNHFFITSAEDLGVLVTNDIHYVPKLPYLPMLVTFKATQDSMIVTFKSDETCKTQIKTTLLLQPDYKN